MRTQGIVILTLALALAPGMGLAQPAAPPNLLPNPSLEVTEPPPPTREQVAAKQQPPPESWLPRTWNVWAHDGAVYKCPDDPAQAHTGRRSVYFNAQVGGGVLRYGPMPVPDTRAWTVRFWARGRGKVAAVAHDVLPDRWNQLKDWHFDLAQGWGTFELQFEPKEGCRKWMLDLATEGQTEVWIDDVLVTYPGLTSLGLPPEGPAGKDDHTLLYLPFEEPLNEDVFFIKQRAELSAPGEGRFGRALVLGAGGYVACSANENLDPRQGTIEVWVKPLWTGNDGVYHAFVSVPGPEGMALHKDQYSHVYFGFSSGWASLSYAFSDGYAYWWQPGVWRHIAACWDQDLLELFVDGKLIAWKTKPKLSRSLGPELAIGSEGMALDDLRISNVVRYRVLAPPS
jgi:hypothetical protein